MKAYIHCLLWNALRNFNSIGLDIHGVIDKYPDDFRYLLGILEVKPKIHIITGARKTPERLQQLKDWGIPYDYYFSIADYLNEQRFGVKFVNNNPDLPYIKNKVLWDRAKGDYCALHNISLHVDDTAHYAEYFTTPFLLFK